VPERFLITAFILILLALLSLVWRWYKGRLARSIGPAEAADRPTLLYFTADYCAPCKFQQSPIVERLAIKLGDQIQVRRIDVSQQPDLATQYKVLTVPTTIVIQPGGTVAHINYGVTDQLKLEAQLL
jgi:thioredoxin 1